MTCVKEKIIHDACKKNGQADFVQETIEIGIRASTVGSCSRGETLSSTSNTTRKRGNLQPKSRVEGCQWMAIGHHLGDGGR